MRRSLPRFTPHYFAQLAVLCVVAFFLARIGADLIDRATFSPALWGRGWLPLGVESFRAAMLEQSLLKFHAESAVPEGVTS